jgi:transcriptional regulator with PAS, ATPase and Fis domain
VKENRLREDLYYRLNVIRIAVPPLRERPEDIAVLAKSFLAKYAAKHGKKAGEFAEDAMELLLSSDWPGNVRELENTIERAVILSRGQTVGGSDLRTLTGDKVSGGTRRVATRSLNLNELEKEAILRALEESDWVKSQAAKKLGIFPSSLYKKMKRLDIPLKPEG